MSTKKLPLTSQGQGRMADALTFDDHVRNVPEQVGKIARRVKATIEVHNGKPLRKENQHVAPRIYGYTGGKPVVFYRVKGVDLVKVSLGEKFLTISSGKNRRVQLPLVGFAISV